MISLKLLHHLLFASEVDSSRCSESFEESSSQRIPGKTVYSARPAGNSLKLTTLVVPLGSAGYVRFRNTRHQVGPLNQGGDVSEATVFHRLVYF